jgi:hypothetical protein
LGLNCVVLFVKLRTRVLLLALLAGFFALPAASASATDPASVTLTMNKSVYVAGDSAEFTSTITATNLDWVVSVQFPGSTDWKPLCVQYNVNDSVQHCTLGVYYNAKVKAVLVDDKTTPSKPPPTLASQFAPRWGSCRWTTSPSRATMQSRATAARRASEVPVTRPFRVSGACGTWCSGATPQAGKGF